MLERTITEKKQVATKAYLDEKTTTEKQTRLSEMHSVFTALDEENRGYLSPRKIKQSLITLGLLPDDPRFKNLFRNLKNKEENKGLLEDEFYELLGSHRSFLLNAFEDRIIIPDFKSFKKTVDDIYEEIKDENGGKVADYIPQLGRVSPDLFGISACSIHGQRYSVGDCEDFFCIQSTCKPINYCLALSELKAKTVHNYVGHEPSGKSFNALMLNDKGLPHNPMINSGAIMCSSLIKQGEAPADRFDHVFSTWKKLAGNKQIGFNNAVYQSEKQTADRNHALAYFMREKGAFPDKVNIQETLEFYFQCCSIEMSTDAMSVVAATLANGGICPLSGEKIFAPEDVKNCLSLMYSCGMYDFSGEFAFSMGFPAKSGVAGAVMIVIPDLLGICVWSPPLDQHGNSVRGIKVCEKLSEKYNFHNYDSLIQAQSEKTDLRMHGQEVKIQGVVALCWASYHGDLLQVQKLLAQGVDINDSDYDGRRMIHLAAAEGHNHIIEYALSHGISLNAQDRWGTTALDDAYRHKKTASIKILEKKGALRGNEVKH